MICTEFTDFLMKFPVFCIFSLKKRKKSWYNDKKAVINCVFRYGTKWHKKNDPLDCAVFSWRFFMKISKQIFRDAKLLSTAKPFCAIALSLILVLSMTACGDGAGPGSGPGTGSTPGDSKDNAIKLNEGVWTNGNITAPDGKQWFKFTAEDTTYIHINFGTLTNFNIQLYDSDNEPVGDEVTLSNSNNKYAPDGLTAGHQYYIKVTPNYGGSGTYQITFNNSATPPVITLILNVWADGNIPTSSGDQWFKFTATATPQYIHIDFDSMTDLYVQLYESDKTTTVGARVNLFGSTKSLSRAVTAGQVYYIKVTPSSLSSGTYLIAFSASSKTPPVALPSNPIQLVKNYWTDGNIPTAGGEQWFKFTATATTQYIHASFGSLSDLYVQLYDSDGYAVGNRANLLGSTKSLNRTVTVGQVYYIKVRPYSSSSFYTGTYQIGYTDNTTAPTAIILPANIPGLTAGIWADGNIPTPVDIEWFKFTATASDQRLHFRSSTLTNLYVQLYNTNGEKVGESSSVSGSNSTSPKNIIRSLLTANEEYYIKITPYSSSYSGTYKIAFSELDIIPFDVTTLTKDIWAGGDLPTSTSEQWFKFTATAAAQRVHFFSGLQAPSMDVGPYLQLYETNLNAFGAQIRILSDRNITLTLTPGQEYYIKVKPYDNSSTSRGSYKIGFNTMPIMPDNVTTLTENIWTDGYVPRKGGVQWFKFTATANPQYIHFARGTMDSVYIWAYTMDGTEVLSEGTSFPVSQTATVGQEYYIKLNPSGSETTGTYRIAFSKSTTTLPVTLPSNAITLTENIFADGNLPTSADTQWFKFTASANPQYIHASFGSLSNLNVQVYDSNGYAVEGRANLSSSTSTRYANRPVTIGQVYYLKVEPYYSSYSGTYQIGFNTSTTVPLIPLPSNAIQLTANTWADGNLLTADSVQWFKFTATGTTQYIHANFVTLSSSDGVNVQLYDSNGAAVENIINLWTSRKYIDRTVVIGQVYYIKVRPYGSNTGTYQIGFNTSTTVPLITLPANAIQLTANTWADGNLPTAGSVQWFMFTATADPQYIHANFGSLNNLYVQLYDSSGAAVGVETNLYSGTKYINRTVTNGQVYYIKVRPYSSNTGTYKIAFNTLPIMPANATTLTAADTWTNGNIPAASGEQWFMFTATTDPQYIHANFGSLNDLFVQLYNSSGAAVGVETNLWGSTKSLNRTVTVGQVYYIKVRPYSSSSGGTFYIAFNTSTTPPTAAP
jgi:stress response protein SCP2